MSLEKFERPAAFMEALSKYYGLTAVEFLRDVFCIRKGLESRSGNIPEDIAAIGLQIIDKAIIDRLASSKGKTFAHHLADAHDRRPAEPAIKPIHIVIMAYWNLSAEQGRNVTTGDVKRYVQNWYLDRKRTLGKQNWTRLYGKAGLSEELTNDPAGRPRGS
jgi:hypothetical protein